MRPIKYVLFFVLIICTGCYPRFEFDSVDHYRIKMNAHDVMDLYDKKRSATEDKLLHVFNENSPFADKTVLARYYTRQTITDNENLEVMASIYHEKFSFTSSHAACVPNYRDILVFKSGNDTIGISKICFECGLHSNTGFKDADIQLSEGDFEKMEALLR